MWKPIIDKMKYKSESERLEDAEGLRMDKSVTYGSKDFEANRKIYETKRMKPIWVRMKCNHHLLYCGNGYLGWKKWWVCEKCGHLETF